MAVAVTAHAQDANSPGLHLTLDLSQRFKSDSNLNLDPVSPGSSFHSSTKLDFGLISNTRTQSLTLNAAVSLRLIDEPGTSSELALDEPELKFDYRLDAARSDLHLDGHFSKTDISLIDSDEAALFGAGDRALYGFGGEIEFGKDAPFGLTFRAGHEVRDYTGTTSPNLFDTKRTDMGITARLQFSPVMQGQLSVNHDTYDAENAERTDRRTSAYSFGITRELSKIAILEASLGYSNIDTDETIGGLRTSTRIDGITGALGLTYAMTNGNLTANLDHIVNQNGGRTSIRFGRSLELPQGSISASIGATRGESDTTRMIGSLNWRHDLPRGNINADLSRMVTTDSDNDEDKLLTRISLGYNQDINAVSSFGLTLSQTLNDEILTGNMVENTSFGATYRRDLTRDWEMDFGYKYRTRDETGVIRAESHSIFLELSRRFSIR